MLVWTISAPCSARSVSSESAWDSATNSFCWSLRAFLRPASTNHHTPATSRIDSRAPPATSTERGRRGQSGAACAVAATLEEMDFDKADPRRPAGPPAERCTGHLTSFWLTPAFSLSAISRIWFPERGSAPGRGRACPQRGAAPRFVFPLRRAIRGDAAASAEALHRRQFDRRPRTMDRPAHRRKKGHINVLK